MNTQFANIVNACIAGTTIDARLLIDQLPVRTKYSFINWCEVQQDNFDMPEIFSLDACKRQALESIKNYKLLDSLAYYMNRSKVKNCTSYQFRHTVKKWRELARPEYNNLLDEYLFQYGLPSLHEAVEAMIKENY